MDTSSQIGTSGNYHPPYAGIHAMRALQAPNGIPPGYLNRAQMLAAQIGASQHEILIDYYHGKTKTGNGQEPTNHINILT